MSLLAQFHARARVAPKRIVFPEGHDPRVVAAAARVRELGIAEPLLVGGDDTAAIDSRDAPRLAAYVEAYARQREVSERIARRMVQRPVVFGGMMVSCGDADGMVVGVDTATATVIQAASLTIGFEAGLSTPSSFFVMIVPARDGNPEQVLLFADCAVVVQPDAQQLAEIGVATAANARRLLQLEPRVAFLSFSTKGSAAHADADKVIAAVARARELAPGLACDGELQADAAIVARVGAKKAPGSVIAGQANVLVFPDLDAGNIAYKLVQYLAGAAAVGPIMQGFRRPVNDMSRGASVEDLVNVAAITVIQAGDA